MRLFEITVQQRPAGDRRSGWPVAVEWSRPGEPLTYYKPDRLRLDPRALEPLLADAYGAYLGDALFGGAAGAAFAAALSDAQGQGEPLHVLLYVEPDDLQSLYWERLCAPLDGGSAPLGLDQRLPFSIYLPSLSDHRFPPIGPRHLKALVVVASPAGLEDYGLKEFPPEPFVGSVRAALDAVGIGSDFLVSGQANGASPTLDTICERLTGADYTLLHVVCHGRYSASAGETALFLDAPDGRVALVREEELVTRLRLVQGASGLPRVVFLSACQTSSPDAWRAQGGIARRLVGGLGLPAVIAMTDLVSVDTAQVLAEAFYRRLRAHGEVDRALVQACAGLAGRPDVRVPALYSRLRGPLFNQALDAELTAADVTYGLRRLGEELPARAPVLCPMPADLPAALRGAGIADPATWSAGPPEQRAHELQTLNLFCLWTLDLLFHALAQGEAPPHYDATAPFLGLYAFQPKDRRFFFGRAALLRRLVERLDAHPFLAVLGPSGSGKSSLVLAGLVPALQQRQAGLQLADFTPGSDPLARLDARLAAVEEGLAVLVVDQFEELFTLCPDEGERETFVERLLKEAARRPVVLTMRADFWGECAAYPALREAMQVHQELIPPMDAEELREAMEQQAAQVGPREGERTGLEFEAGLANTLVDDVRGEPGAMPLLQHALLELWRRRQGRWLLGAAYESMGGVTQAIARTADKLYDDLPAEQELIRDIFVRLTRLADEPGTGEERRDTRRRVALDDLVPAGSGRNTIRGLVQRLADCRLVVTSMPVRPRATRDEPATLQDDVPEQVEVAHEALIRYWPRLRRWLDDDRANLTLRARIGEQAHEWETSSTADGSRDDTLLLLRGGRLDDARGLALRPGYLNASERAYVEACLALQEREITEAEAQRQRDLKAAQELAEERRRTNRRLQIAAGVLVALLVAVIGFWAQADLARGVAEIQRTAAEMSRQAAEAEVSQRLEIDRSIPLAISAFDTAHKLRKGPSTSSSVITPLLDAGGLLHSLSGPLQAAGLLHERPSVDSALVQVRRVLLTTLQSYPEVAGFRHQGLHTDAGAATTARPTAAETPPLVALVVGPEQRVVAARTETGAAVLWELSTPGGVSWHLPPEGSAVRTLAFHPRRPWLAVGDADGRLSIWLLEGRGTEAIRRVCRYQLPGGGAVTAVQFHPASDRLATAQADGTLALWNIENAPSDQCTVEQTIRATITGQGDDPGLALVRAIAFHPSGEWLAVGGFSGALWRWNFAHADGIVDAPRSLLPAVVRAGTPTRPVPAILDLSITGTTLLGRSADDQSHRWDISESEGLIARPALVDPGLLRVTALAVSPSGTHVAAATADGRILQWQVVGGDFQPASELRTGRNASLNSIAWASDEMLLVGDSGGVITLLTTAPEVLFRPVDGPFPDHPLSMAFSSDGRLIAVGGWHGKVQIWRVADGVAMGPPLSVDTDKVPPIMQVALARRILAIRGKPSATSIWLWGLADDGRIQADRTGVCDRRLPNMTVIGTPQDSRGERAPAVTAMGLSKDGSTLIAGYDDGSIVSYVIEVGDAITCRTSGSAKCERTVIHSIVVDEDMGSVAAGLRSGAVGEILPFLNAIPIPACPLRVGDTRHIGPVVELAAGPTAKTLASGSEDGTVNLWRRSPQDPALLLAGTLPVSSVAVRGISMNADSTLLVSTADDKELVLWDLAGRRRIAALAPNDRLPHLCNSMGNQVPPLARFHPSAISLAVAIGDASCATVLLGDIDDESIVARGRAVVSR